MSNALNIKTYLMTCKENVEKAILYHLPDMHTGSSELNKAMQYAMMSGGKRIRAAFIYAVGEALDADAKILDSVSAAVEMLHAYTLIHDDLPALDNDDLRRGKPSCHKAFGEATAILAGDYLQSLSYNILSNLDRASIDDETHLQMIQVLSKAALNVATGEELDILMEGKNVSLEELQYTYKLKTGELLTASILLGALAANCKDTTVLHSLKQFGEEIGLVFQIHDDIIGVESETEILGKPKGSDELRQKPTYPSLLGLAESKAQEELIYNKAIDSLNKLDMDTTKLIAISQYVISRVN